MPGLGSDAATRPAYVAAVLPVQGSLAQVAVAIQEVTDDTAGTVLVPDDAAVMAVTVHLNTRLEARLAVVNEVIKAGQMGTARLGLKAVAPAAVVRTGAVATRLLLTSPVLGAGATAKAPAVLAMAAAAGSGRNAADEIIEEASVVGPVALREVLVAAG